MTERTTYSLSEKIIHYDSLVEENERLKIQLKKEKAINTEFKIIFYRKLKAKLDRALKGNLNLYVYKCEVLDKIEDLKNQINETIN